MNITRQLPGIINSIYVLLSLNVCYFFSNFLFLFLNFGFKLSALTIPFFVISFLFIFPSLFSVIRCIKKFKTGVEFSSPAKEYLQIYKSYFGKINKFSFILVLTLIVLYVDARFFMKFPYLIWINPILVFLMFTIFTVFSRWIVEYAIRDTDYFESNVTFKQLLYLTFRSWSSSLLFSLFTLTIILLMITKSTIGYLVAPSIISVLTFKIYFIYESRYNNKIHKK